MNLFEFVPMVQEMSFKIYHILSSGGPPYSVERNHLCNFERGHNGEHSCEVILNLDQWFRRSCRLKKTFAEDR